MKLSYANVTSTLALVLALGGVSYAATQLPRNSVGGRQLKANSVTGAKVRDRSLTSRDFDLATQFAPRGPRGPEGPGGSRGPSDAYFANGAGGTLPGQANVVNVEAVLSDLPPGNYVVSSTAETIDFNNGGEIVRCDIRLNGDVVAGSSVVIGNGSGSGRALNLAASAGISSNTPFRLTLTCSSDQALAQPPGIAQPHLTAIRVESLRSGSG
jgi:hypothetical protein